MAGEPIIVKYPAEFRRQVYDQFLAAKVPHGMSGVWCENKAREIGVNSNSVRNWIAHFREMDAYALDVQSHTPAQATALMLGAGKAEAIATLRRNLRAHNIKVVTDREGNVLSKVFVPDPAAQNAAAIALLKVHGGFAPEKTLQLSKTVDDPEVMSDAELEAELAKLTQHGPRDTNSGT